MALCLCYGALLCSTASTKNKKSIKRKTEANTLSRRVFGLTSQTDKETIIEHTYNN